MRSLGDKLIFSMSPGLLLVHGVLTILTLTKAQDSGHDSSTFKHLIPRFSDLILDNQGMLYVRMEKSTVEWGRSIELYVIDQLNLNDNVEVKLGGSLFTHYKCERCQVVLRVCDYSRCAYSAWTEPKRTKATIPVVSIQGAVCDQRKDELTVQFTEVPGTNEYQIFILADSDVQNVVSVKKTGEIIPNAKCAGHSVRVRVFNGSDYGDFSHKGSVSIQNKVSTATVLSDGRHLYVMSLHRYRKMVIKQADGTTSSFSIPQIYFSNHSCFGCTVRFLSQRSNDEASDWITPEMTLPIRPAVRQLSIYGDELYIAIELGETGLNEEYEALLVGEDGSVQSSWTWHGPVKTSSSRECKRCRVSIRALRGATSTSFTEPQEPHVNPYFSSDQNFWVIVRTSGFKLMWDIRKKPFDKYKLLLKNFNKDQETEMILPRAMGTEDLTLDLCSVYQIRLIEVSTKNVLKEINFVSEQNSEFPFPLQHLQIQPKKCDNHISLIKYILLK
ncbi:hypothetical protein FGIG_10776 [Fasciola gigantica]|uniref:Uncharacterized protein n=1 Tax=Fasciola gigantica TaxID=46835 RepID=A0A504Y9P2_FASGI|nr:hypothetical protein FGIG_10776 [Fasciola gigantica]